MEGLVVVVECDERTYLIRRDLGRIHVEALEDCLEEILT